MTNTTPTLAEIEHLIQIASGELVLMRGRIRMEATGTETAVEFYLPARFADQSTSTMAPLSSMTTFGAV